MPVFTWGPITDVPCPIQNHCFSCTADGTCIDCLPGYAIDGVECKSICAIGEFWDDTGSQCAQCQEICLTCSSLSSCDTCELPRIPVAGECVCPDGYRSMPSGNCNPCPASKFCRTCSSFPAARCLSCSNGQNREISVFGTCVCRAGFVQLNPSDAHCTPL